MGWSNLLLSRVKPNIIHRILRAAYVRLQLYLYIYIYKYKDVSASWPQKTFMSRVYPFIEEGGGGCMIGVLCKPILYREGKIINTFTKWLVQVLYTLRISRHPTIELGHSHCRKLDSSLWWCKMYIILFWNVIVPCSMYGVISV